MTGHAPKAALDEIAKKLYNGSSFMMPTEDHLWVATELERRFGLSHWQYALSASDANRFAIRWARLATGRLKTLVFNHSYHGAVDESLVELDDNGNVVKARTAREQNIDSSVESKFQETEFHYDFRLKVRLNRYSDLASVTFFKGTGSTFNSSILSSCNFLL